MTGSGVRPILSGPMMHGSPMPQGVVANGFIFLSALRGIDGATENLVPGIIGQTRRAFEIAQELLAAEGCTLADIVRVGIFMRDLQRDRPSFNQVWRELFGDAGPARFAVEVSDIGRPGDDTAVLLDIVAACR